MSDRSLDDFLSESEETADEAADTEAEASESGTPEESTVDPAVATATVSPDGTTCPSCGETARRCWHDDGTYVCRECKEW